MSESIIPLENDFVEVGIAPEIGASIAYFKTKGHDPFDVMRPASSTAIAKKEAVNMAMFPMLPYTNHIKGGKFTYWGITRIVPANHPSEHDPIHGDGWKAKWNVDKKTKNAVTLSYAHDKNSRGFPFSYNAKVTYTLEGRTLKVEMFLENTSILPMPCGVGVHPFFPKMPGTKLTFETKNVWYHENDPIDRPYKTPAEWSFEGGKELNDAIFDTCFGGFGGKAAIVWPKAKKELDISTDIDFGHVVLYAPYRKNFFCLEPSTMANNAFNLASEGVIGSGIKSLGPKESMTAAIEFTIKDTK